VKRHDVIQLLERYRNGQCSPDECDLVEHCYDQWNANNPSPLSEEELSAIEDEMWSQLLRYERKKVLRFHMYIKAVAAMLLLGLLFGTYQYTSQSEIPMIDGIDSIKTYDIQAARDRAVLRLSSGEHIVLDSLPVGFVREDGATRVTKDSDGYLVFEAVTIDKDTQKKGFNEIQTPKGGHYKITLIDGTTVWLGPESSFSYPTSFAVHERRVRLKGDAYFEVAKKSSGYRSGHKPNYIPFFVETARQTVQVLGTHFNVSDYANDPASRVTLLEGSVKVHSGSSKIRLLSPGQQSTVQTKNQELQVHRIDVAQYLTQKDGNFCFNNTELQEVMRQLERWYDIEVVDLEQLPANRYSGKLPQRANLSKILQVIEITSGLKFKIEKERRLILVR